MKYQTVEHVNAVGRAVYTVRSRRRLWWRTHGETVSTSAGGTRAETLYFRSADEALEFIGGDANERRRQKRRGGIEQVTLVLRLVPTISPMLRAITQPGPAARRGVAS
jgi:hypothetical protein